MHRKAFIVFILLMFLSGCTADEEQLIDEGGIEFLLLQPFLPGHRQLTIRMK